MSSLPVNILLLLLHHTVIIHVIIHILLWILALLDLGLVDHLLHCLLLVHLVWIVHDLLLNIVLWLLLVVVFNVVQLDWLLWTLSLLHLVVFELGKTAFVAWVSEGEVLVLASAAAPGTWSFADMHFVIWRAHILERFVGCQRSLLLKVDSLLVLGGLDDSSFLFA